MLADHAVIPEPGFRIDWLPDTAKQPQRFPGCFLYRPFAITHQGADRGGSGVEYIHAVLVDDLPEAAAVRVIGYSLEHQGRRAVRQRAVHNISVSGHPADIGSAPVNVARMVVEYQLVGEGSPDHVAAGGVQHAFR